MVTSDLIVKIARVDDYASRLAVPYLNTTSSHTAPFHFSRKNNSTAVRACVVEMHEFAGFRRLRDIDERFRALHFLQEPLLHCTSSRELSTGSLVVRCHPTTTRVQNPQPPSQRSRFPTADPPFSRDGRPS